MNHYPLPIYAIRKILSIESNPTLSFKFNTKQKTHRTQNQNLYTATTTIYYPKGLINTALLLT